MADTKPKVDEKDHDEDKSEVLGNLVKVVVLIWSASLLTFSYVRLPNGQKILDFDPTFIASVFSGSLAAFGLSPAKAGGGNGSTKKKRDEPSSRAIFAEFGTNAKKKDDNKTTKIPVFIITARFT